jgi:hypothetical protein
MIIPRNCMTYMRVFNIVLHCEINDEKNKTVLRLREMSKFENENLKSRR